MGKKVNVDAEIRIPKDDLGNFHILDVEMAISYIETTEGIKVLDTTITGYTQESLKRLIEALPELE